MDPEDRSVRVLVGRKGAGKTLYLRRLQTAADDDGSIYADDWQTTVFTTDYVLQMTEWYPDDSTAIERWHEVWRRAILRSLVSHLLHAPELRSQLGDYGERLQRNRPGVHPRYESPESIYDQVRDIVGGARDHKRLEQRLRHRDWPSLEYLLGDVLKQVKPVFFYIDALDKYFEHAPRQWVLCQLGLFNAVFELLNDSRMGGRLHVVIGIRDIVFSSTQMTEHAMKYHGSPHIRHLAWNRPAIAYFLDHKLRSLDPEYLMDPSADRLIERWLGIGSVYNEKREQNEDIERYLLRHTRLIPRDIVQMGNMLCKLIDRAQDHDQPFLAEVEIREVVRTAARRFGREELLTVANHLTAEAMPRGAVRHGYSDSYTAQGMDEIDSGYAYQLAVADDVGELLGGLQHDRFSRDDLLDLENQAADLVTGRANLLDILWQHGLLGYIEGPLLTGRAIFYNLGDEDSTRLPRGKRAYALHPILIDTIDELSGIGAPVDPE